MKENNAGVKSNLRKVDRHAISPAGYTEIPPGCRRSFSPRGSCIETANPWSA